MSVLKYLVGLLVGVSAAGVSASVPWYFDVLDLDLLKESRVDTKNISVAVIDSGVSFVGGLKKSQGFESFSYTSDGNPRPVNNESAGRVGYIHGTAMASIIAYDSKWATADKGLKEGVSLKGIFPSVSIVSRKTFPSPSTDSWISAISAAGALKAGFPGHEKIINVSGGQSKVDASRATAWIDLISRIGRENSKLIVAAVGNDSASIDSISHEQRIWPAAYRPKLPLRKKEDPVVRVAALAQYKKGENPKLYSGSVSGSRFGRGWVDIAAPGQNIPYMTPDGAFASGAGTSEAAAIVSGVLAVMASCSPSSSAQALKSTLLETADRYPVLEDKVAQGRVLNAGKAIDMFCSKAEIEKVLVSEKTAKEQRHRAVRMQSEL
ncbi:S8 family serine peptidase [Pseudomonas sp. ANT_H12B]|uniref:S8 family peptidase n=1 Tax=Pseudomonas sp. ANT_H12B TaxID=2597348 RepID=UPI0011ED17BB|nr:S8 family serine peptidase [Pseudomonas sp. ANT_H12B]KAA0967682.1 S8/S53 family peptidase [Pseudomonas sp. ANT_H12B]